MQVCEALWKSLWAVVEGAGDGFAMAAMMAATMLPGALPAIVRSAQTQHTLVAAPRFAAAYLERPPASAIAEIIGKSQANVRQLATRARRHVEERRPRFQTTRQQRDELARRFFTAVEQGDLAGLEALLASDVQLTGDGGGKVPTLARTLHGRARIARRVINWFRLLARIPGLSVWPVEVNGSPGARYVDAQGRPVGVLALDVAGSQIWAISSIVNPDKLAHLGPLGDYAALLRSAR